MVARKGGGPVPCKILPDNFLFRIGTKIYTIPQITINTNVNLKSAKTNFSPRNSIFRILETNTRLLCRTVIWNILQASVFIM